MEKEASNLTQQLNLLKEQISKAEQRKSNLDKQILANQSEIHKQNETINGHSSTIDQMNEKIKISNQEYEKLQNDIKSLSAAKSKFEIEANNIQNTIKLHKEECEKLKLSLSMGWKQNKELEKTILERQKHAEQLDQNNHLKEEDLKLKMQEKIKELEIENNVSLDIIGKKKAASNDKNFIMHKLNKFELKANEEIVQQHKKDERKAYINDKRQFFGNMKPDKGEINNSTYTREQKYGKDTLKEKIIFLDKNGKQINDVEIIRQNYDRFGSAMLYKQNESNKDIYEHFNEEKDFENNCEIFLAHQNTELEIE